MKKVFRATSVVLMLLCLMAFITSPDRVNVGTLIACSLIWAGATVPTGLAGGLVAMLIRKRPHPQRTRCPCAVPPEAGSGHR